MIRGDGLKEKKQGAAMNDPDEKGGQTEKSQTTYEDFLLDENPENVTAAAQKPAGTQPKSITLEVQNIVIRIAADRS